MKYKEQVNTETGEKRWVPEETTPTLAPSQSYEASAQPSGATPEWEKLGISPITYGAGKTQEYLGKSSFLPAAYSTAGRTLGGTVGHPSLGAGAGGAVGEWLKQWASKGGIGGAIPSGQEAGQIAKTGAVSGLTDFLLGKTLKAGGKLFGKGKEVVSKGGEKLQEFLGIPKGYAGRQATSQVLQPSAGQIRASLNKEGVSETLEAARKYNLKGKNAFQVKKMAQGKTSSLWKKISSFLKTNKDELPTIRGEEITNVLDDEIARYNSLGEFKTAGELQKMKDGFSGIYSFDRAYNLVKSWGQESRNIYKAGKNVIDVKPWKAKTQKLLADQGRAVLKEEATKAGFEDWANMMNQYHDWSSILTFANVGASKLQTPLGGFTATLYRMLGLGLPVVEKTGQLIGQGGRAIGKGASAASGPLLEFLTQSGVYNIGKKE